MSSTTTPAIKSLGLLALDFARAAEDVAHHKIVLEAGYMAWREGTGNQHTHIERGSEEWDAMMQATKPEYRDLQNAKGRERRAKAKLVQAAGQVQARINKAMEG